MFDCLPQSQASVSVFTRPASADQPALFDSVRRPGGPAGLWVFGPRDLDLRMFQMAAGVSCVRSNAGFDDYKILTGACRGVDRLAEIAAIYGLLSGCSGTRSFPAHWKTLGRSAGAARTAELCRTLVSEFPARAALCFLPWPVNNSISNSAPGSFPSYEACLASALSLAGPGTALSISFARDFQIPLYFAFATWNYSIDGDPTALARRCEDFETVRAAAAISNKELN